jgi:anti-anti-sigma factor
MADLIITPDRSGTACPQSVGGEPSRPTGTQLARACGEIDMCTVPGLRTLLLAQLVSPPAVLEVDLTHVTFLSVTALGVLTEVGTVARAAGTDLRLTGTPRRAVARVLRLFGWPVPGSVPNPGKGRPWCRGVSLGTSFGPDHVNHCGLPPVGLTDTRSRGHG